VNPEQWQVIRRIFHEAVVLPAGERDEFIVRAAEGDESLRMEVQSLLASHDRAASFIESESDQVATVARDRILADEMIGRRVGTYRIVREIGRGGMGAVYQGVRDDAEFSKRVAIKLIRTGMNTASVVRRFLSERQILANLDHPNIARLLDGGTSEEGLPYFVMEYIEGQPIKEYCDTRRLETDERLKLFRDVCSAVHYAHQNLVIHRDIKPRNILVTPDGTVKLLDFGIAKLLLPGPGRDETTQAAARAMTPDYASPEQARGDPITTSSDVYSLGVLLYELLTGHRPYRITSGSPVEIIRAICEQEPDKPSTAIARVETVPAGDEDTNITLTPESVSKARASQPDKLRRELEGDLDNIVLKAMRKEPQRRYASAEQLSEDIRRYLNGLPVIARKDTVSYRTGKFVRRHKAGVAAAGLILLILVAGIIGTTRQTLAARRERATAVRRFNDIRQLANSFMFEFHDAIKELPGSTHARELVVQRALQYLDGLAAEAGDDPSLKRELATAYEKVGDVQGDPYSPSLGDSASALVSHRKALALREALVAADPSNVALRRELAASYMKIGDIVWLDADWNGAQDAYRKARDIDEALSAADPGNRDLRYDLSMNDIGIGDTLVQTGDLDAALAEDRKGLAIRLELNTVSPDAKTKRGVATAHIKLGDVLAAKHELDEAVEDYNRAISTLEEMCRQEPSSFSLQTDLENSLQRLGEALMKQGRTDQAITAFRRTMGIGEAQAAADPANAVAKRNLAGAISSLAGALDEKGDYAEALAMYDKTLKIVAPLSAADPANAQGRGDVEFCYEAMAGVLAKMNNLAEAERNYRKALAMEEELLATSHQGAQIRHDTADVQLALARVLRRMGNPAEALELERKALATCDALVTELPSNNTYLYELALACADLGDSLGVSAGRGKAGASARTDVLKEALAKYSRSAELMSRMKERGNLEKTGEARLAEVNRQISATEAALRALPSAP
jgi:non-specific serine/threonine protein kinase/serine/threonine-protein kinase